MCVEGNHKDIGGAIEPLATSKQPRPALLTKVIYEVHYEVHIVVNIFNLFSTASITN